MSSSIQSDAPVISTLPSFTSAQLPNFNWGEVDGPTIVDIFDQCYDEIVHWKRNIFKVPSGKSGKSFVREMSRLLNAFGDASALEVVALKAAMVMPALLLQKPHRRSKAKEHSSHLNRRLALWNSGNIMDLIKEARSIQHHITQSSHKSPEELARSFSKLMMEGKVKKAMKLLSDNSSGGPLSLTEEVKTKLQEKHPVRKPPSFSAILPSDPESDVRHHPIIFDQIDAQCICKTVLQMDGAAGPSGLDIAAWKRLCCSFGESSSDLCAAIVSVARRLCTDYVDPTCTLALVAGRLIALDKCPGIRPIGVGEALRRIIARSITAVLKDDIRKAAGHTTLWWTRIGL